MAVAARKSVSQAATPEIRAICAALSAQRFPLAPLKVADTTGGKNSVPAENGQYKRLDDTSVDDITGFYCIRRPRRKDTPIFQVPSLISMD